jgi:hypothetical protein
VTPSPPVALITFTGTRSSCSSSTASWRATRSLPPPAAHGQTIRIGASGNSWRPAQAARANANSTAANFLGGKARRS